MCLFRKCIIQALSLEMPSYIVDLLSLKAPVATLADDSLEYFFILIFFFFEKMRLDILCESSVRQRIHIKHQALFSSTVKVNKIKVSSAAILFGSLRFNPEIVHFLKLSYFGLL